MDISINVSPGEMWNLLFEINENVLATMSFELTDTDQYTALPDVNLEGRIKIVFYPKLGSYLGRKMVFLGRIQL